MNIRFLKKSLGFVFSGVFLALVVWKPAQTPPISQAASVITLKLPDESQLEAFMAGHEFRQDDQPSIAVAPDGSVWFAFLSFDGNKDDIGLRQYRDGVWWNLQWVPGTSGDSWSPKVAADDKSRVWVVWAQQYRGNWDIYARRYDPAEDQWSSLYQLSRDPLPDLHPYVWSDGQGRAAVVWQGFRAGKSNIFLSFLNGDEWSEPIRVTNRPANDWKPVVAVDSHSTAWIAYDSYKNGDYDVFLAQVTRDGKVVQVDIPVAVTRNFEVRPSIVIDREDRVWVAWEQGPPNWGKDQGYVIRHTETGAPLGGRRTVLVRCYHNGRWSEPPTPVGQQFEGVAVHLPHLFTDKEGNIWVMARVRGQGRQEGGTNLRNYWEFQITRLVGDRWQKPVPLPNAKGRSSMEASSALAADGTIWLAWATDGRQPSYYHRPRWQRVYAGRLLAKPMPAPLSLEPVKPVEISAPPQHHPDEPGDVKRIRSYTVTIAGKQHRIVRGDFHRHTELSWDGGGGNDGSLEDFYRYMIDAAAMDFGASTDHQGGAWPYWWWYTQKMADMYMIPGTYVSIYGFERSTTYPFGHRNIFYARRSEARVIPFFMQDGVKQHAMPLGALGDEPPVGTGQVSKDDTRLLYEELRRLNGLAISHTSATRMGTDWSDYDPEVEPVVEIYQGARTNYEDPKAPFAADPIKDKEHIERAGYQPAGFVVNAWGKGYRLGIITSSDHGSTHISYAMVYTDDFSREGILNAIRARKTYGAMDNIIVEAWMGNHFMGEEFELTRAEPLRIRIRGTSNISSVAVIKDGKAVYTVTPNKVEVDLTYLDQEKNTGRHYYYVRIQQEDGLLAWSSPFFVHYPRW